ncbi:pentatricopeptide repeat-containing protein At1g11290, chloroplastic-like [Lolium perenne]|uniref:pentatricopeptide repeat-containing protein At1g11290, chloroplastic-like n=1 Tax=Lolium perenne TaxID=4522 RepID=UPI0021EACC71|nr:pentatricopeptide repeat-containing protein At3g21470-like [Lolium perenne]
MAARAKQLHAHYLAAGCGDLERWARLVKEYAGSSFLRLAAQVYSKNLPRQTHHLPLIPVLLKAAASRPRWPGLSLGRSLHAEAIKVAFDRDLLVGTTLVSMYCKGGLLADARVMFDGMPGRNAVTCNAMLDGYAAAGDMGQAEALFVRMASRTPVTWATLIRGFADKGDMEEARRWFSVTPVGMRTVVTWTVLVQGFVAVGDMEAARELFDAMPARNAFVWSSMVTGYFKAGNADEARAMFDRIPVPNLVNWNSLIAGYAQIGCSEQALQAFHAMLENRIKPDEFTMSSVLSACAQLGSLEQGRKVHELINQKHILKNPFVLNGLVDMYAKCGDLAYARQIFDNMQRRNTQCWNSMISALASHGQSEEAIQLFSQMECSKQKPDGVTLLAVLGACTHGGFVEEGLRIFNSFSVYGVATGVEHYGCLVDLLGRAGRLEEAYAIVKNMAVESNEVIWGALLGACRVHANREMSERVSNEINQLRSDHASTNDAEYITLSNILAESERWEQAERVRRKMASHGVEKTPGCSSVELDISENKLYCRQ